LVEKKVSKRVVLTVAPKEARMVVNLVGMMGALSVVKWLLRKETTGERTFEETL
jgi:hypothetical protein